ncbi:glycosyl transferase family 2 [Vibrio breoganii]|uniref:glycosyltransferase family 2 protein n=1 Tax=Vibrio breoganii TaxID=553239 RepID=UPI000C82795A|nr:glycosyltransferase family 2 protein [Vibrio breoganii]PMO99178.1 glycosyl transferase family 2 [Vibrio breoganii]
MAVYISIVSHGHADLLLNLNCVPKLIANYQVIIKSNKKFDDFGSLGESDNFHWLNDDYGKGFGENNNIVFNYCLHELGMKCDDYFIVLNPDIVIDNETIARLIEEMNESLSSFSTINLFKDRYLTIPDNSVRNFPSFKHFVTSFLGKGNASILDRRTMLEQCQVDWAAGSFLAFRAQHYLNLRGFDENYFMYCEDIDICFRSLNLDVPLKYHPEIKAQHLAKHSNRKLFSIHFLWHVKSSFRFLLSKRGLTNSTTSIKLK